MRLTCPNCHSEYEVPDGMVPAAGRHVQCTACHTRWFARGEAAPAPSEDQIVARLEARVPARPAIDESVADEPASDEPAAVEPGATEPAATEAPEPPSPVVPLRPVGPPKPSGEPSVLRPGPFAAAPRAVPRLDLAPAALPAAAPAPSAGRFGLGLGLALVLFLLALGAYDFRRDVAAELPAAAPALDAYADAVDDLRAEIERRLAPLRQRLGRTTAFSKSEVAGPV